MIKTVTQTDFLNAFSDSNNFSYEGLIALFNYFEELEECTRQPIYLDPISICCDYTAYDSLYDLQTDYPDIESLDELEKHTEVIPVNQHIDDSIIIRNF